MKLTDSATRIGVTWDALASVGADLLVVPIFDDDDLSDLADLDAATGRGASAALASGAISGKPYRMLTTAIVDDGWGCRRVLLVGAGPRTGAVADLLRRVVSAAVVEARGMRTARLAIVDRFAPRSERTIQAIADAIVSASFETAAYKTGPRERSRIEHATIVLREPRDAVLEAAAERGAVIGDCCNVAKSLAQEPGNVLPPRVLAERASATAAAVGLGVEVLDEAAIRSHAMGLLLGVAQGSSEAPRLVVLRHDPPEASGDEVLGLVGKGVTFDTGGISIKPADKMELMKYDMSGGAAVIAAMRAIAILGAPVRAIGVVPCVENMPSGTAIRPGDVLTGASGTTVEITNTDAEGRLILGDALWYARTLGATRLVDVATLTGACVVALGKSTSGLFGAPPAWVDLVGEVANAAGDRAWTLPVFDDYREQLHSEIADIMNAGSRAAGSITAAMFLKEFVGEVPWAHLDVAGTAWAEEEKPYQPKGPTGVAVRTMTELAFSGERW